MSSPESCLLLICVAGNRSGINRFIGTIFMRTQGAVGQLDIVHVSTGLFGCYFPTGSTATKIVKSK